MVLDRVKNIKIIDLTHPIIDNLPVFPGDEPTGLYQNRFLAEDGYNNHRLEIDLHTGTHIDGPMHLTDSNTYISDIPLESFIGIGSVLDLSKEKEIKFKEEYNNKVKENSILLLYTGQSKKIGRKEYFQEHPIIHEDFAKFIIRKGVKMIGLDSPSPDNYPFEIHKLFFKNNVLIMENLINLELLLNIIEFEVISLPLNIKADSSIARVIARIVK